MKLFLFTLLSLVPFICKAQTDLEGIHFFEGTFNEALTEAKAQHKNVFIDCYTSWCGPCRRMSKEVFTQKSVGDFFNKNFVCLQIDMEKGEGINLHQQYAVAAYPTFLYLNEEGELIHRLVGYMEASDFIKSSWEGLDGNNLTAMQQRFQTGEVDDAFLLQYFKTLSKAGMQKEAKEVAIRYLENKSDIIAKNDTSFAMFFMAVDSPDSPSFQYFWKHPNDFAKYPKQVVELKGQRVWANYARQLVENGLFESRIESYYKQMKEENVEKAESYKDAGYIYYYGHQKEWSQYVSAVSDYIKNYPSPELNMQFCNWAGVLAEQCSDERIRFKMLKMVEQREEMWKKEEEEKQKQKLPKGTMRAASLIDFQQTFNTLKEKLSKK